MPNRYVREAAIESEKVNSLCWQAEVFYRRLLNRVDDFGRFTAHPELLRAAVFPMQLNKVSAADVGKLLLECEHADLLCTWKGQLDGKPYLVMQRWEQGRAKQSKYPEPPEDVRRRLHMFANAPDSDTDSDTDSDKRKLEQAIRIYEAYPRKVARPKAIAAIRTALGKIAFEALLRRTELYAKSVASKDPQYIPYPATWFNQERFNDASSANAPKHRPSAI